MNDATRQNSNVTTGAPWGAWPPVTARLPAQDVTRLLRCEGSLTAALREYSDNTFGLEVMREKVLPLAGFQTGGLDPSRGVVREVVLSGRDTPWVFAQTIIPVATITAHPWVSRMGGQPLGDALFHREDVTRSALSFALLDPQMSLCERVAQLRLNPEARLLWSRRSCFFLGNEPLLITEVFLPGLCPAP